MKTVRTNSRNWDTDPKDGLNHNPIKFDPSTFKLIKWKNPSGFNVGNQVKYAGDFKLLQDKIGTVTEVINRNLLICEFEGGIITDVNPSELISFRLNGFTDSSTPSGIEYVGDDQRFIAGTDIAKDKSITVIYDKENNTYNISIDKTICHCPHEPKTKLRLESACENCKKEFYKWLETQENAFSQVRPPLGLKPQWIHNELRLNSINDAIERYEKEKKDIPTEWLKEKKYLEQSKKSHPKHEYVSKKLPKVFLKEDGDVFIVAFEGEDVISQHLNDFTAPTWLSQDSFSMNIKFFGLIKTILDLKNINFKIVK